MIPMRRVRRLPALLLCMLAVTLSLPPALLTRAQEATPLAGKAERAPLLVLAAPSMQPDLIATYSAAEALPNLTEMMATGAQGRLSPPFPATTGTSLSTLLTGTWPAEHGVVGDSFYRTGSPDFAENARWTDAGLIQADTLPQAAERAGKQVVIAGWPSAEGLNPAIQGPVVGNFVPLSQAGVATTTPDATLAEQARAQNLGYEALTLADATGWTNVPQSFSPARETAFTVRSLDPAGINPDLTLNAYIFDTLDDSTTNYNQILLSPGKDAAQAALLAVGTWAGVGVELAGDATGQRAGFWVKVQEFTPDLANLNVYYTAAGRLPVSWAGCTEREECTAAGGITDAVNRMLGPVVGIDPAPLDAGLIDAATFAEQGATSTWQTIDAVRYLVTGLGVQPDLLMLGAALPGIATRHLADEIPTAPSEGEEPADSGMHQGHSTAGSTPAAGGMHQGHAAAGATPAAGGMQHGPDLGPLGESYIMADEMLAVGQELLGPEANTLFATTDRLAISTAEVNAGVVLQEAGLAEGAQPGNCIPAAVTLPPGTPDPEALPVGPQVKACWSGGTAAISINVDGREAAGSVAEDGLTTVQDAVVAAFSDLKDPANPEATVVAKVLRQDELRDVQGADALHPSRAGDVIVVLNPPYRFGEGDVSAAIAPAPMLAADGYLLPDSDGLMLAAGPAIAQTEGIAAKATDVAATAAFLLDVPGPFNASGNILLSALADGPALREVTILDISDFHGQLPPLSATADLIEADGSVGTSYPVGGVAVLKPWFDRYRDAAIGPVLLVAGGDSVGATPPISTAFGDEPTIEIMNMLGFTADGLGNHNFDAGTNHMFGTLAPLADFPYLSANLVPARADAATTVPPAETFQPSLLLDLDGAKVGLIGFSNPDIPALTAPGALDPYRVVDPVEPVNAEAAALRQQGAAVIVALGHMGAIAGELTAPLGPVVEMTDALSGVDVVIGDHTDMQVVSIRPNDILLVENRSKGVMFTRVRLVIDSESNTLVYRTADFHRPWVAGMAPDPEIAARLDALAEELAPTLGLVIGSAVQPILRSDSCGMETGRLCESLIGDVLTDAMRFTYNTDFAITNSGGIRADLTCPPEGGDFCPTDLGPNQISQGQVLSVLPFGNVAVTLEISGAELKEMLEAGVSRMPDAAGAFPQVSGLCFTYDVTAEPGSRVQSAVRQTGDGSCSGEAVEFSEQATYTLTTNDFTASGGDGYPPLLARASTRDVLASVLATYIASDSALGVPGAALDPRLQGRIVCEGEGCPTPIP